MATQFGGGARKGEMCGAVSGALMVLGLKYGHCHSENDEEKGRAYQISEDFMNRFIQKNGTVVCRELLGYDLSEPEDMKKIMDARSRDAAGPTAPPQGVTLVEIRYPQWEPWEVYENHESNR